MRVFLFILMFSFTTAVAMADTLEQIEREAPRCLTASYHASASSARTVRAVKATVFRQSESDPTLYMKLKVNVRGKTHEAFLLCDRAAEGAYLCGVECDGGRARLQDLGKGRVRLVNEGILLTGGCDGSQEEQWLAPFPDDEIFDLGPAPRSICE